jgi:hypothetical protein
MEKLNEQKLSIGDKINELKNKKTSSSSSINKKLTKTLKNSQKYNFSNNDNFGNFNNFTNLPVKLTNSSKFNNNSNIVDLEDDINLNFNRIPNINEDQQSTSSQSSKLNPKRLCAKKSAKGGESSDSNSMIEKDINQPLRNKFQSYNFNSIKEDDEFLNAQNFKNYELPLNDSQNIDQEDPDNISECCICNWKFPHFMSEDEKNAHINFCVEGRGQEHRDNYMKSLNLISTQEKSRDNSMMVDEENMNLNNLNCNLGINQQRKDKCPICKKVLGMKLDKNIQKHIFDCTRAHEAMIDNGGRKRKFVLPK